MSYINDPRENIINLENGYVLENDNRTEEMYKWSGKILDLCGLPVEEYMKPMTVIVDGSISEPGEDVETQYTLTFMNGSDVISSSEVKPGTIISYPKMSDTTINGIDYTFVWLDLSYNGKAMPKKNLTIVGEYKEKAKAPILYGVFITSSTTPDSKIFNENEALLFKKVSIEECLAGVDVDINVPADKFLTSEEGNNLSDEEWDAYRNAHLCPHCFLVPVEVSSMYTLEATNGDTKNELVSDKEIIKVNNSDYHLYTYLNAESMKVAEFEQTWEYHLELA